ncbi:unnamed protein product [Calicophoron daubneyi]|uniref:serine--tRNA ligase n=1 Tax=Calicophoron daubneyi TaxID=300641 RepID=A0AAV2TA71_CALDB
MSNLRTCLVGCHKCMSGFGRWNASRRLLVHWPRKNSSSTLIHPSRRMSHGSSPVLPFQPCFDLKLLSDQNFIREMRDNIMARESPVDFERLLELYKRFTAGEKDATQAELLQLIRMLPNTTHPLTPVGDYSKARLIYLHGAKPTVNWKLQDAVALASLLPSSLPSGATKSTSVFNPAPHLRVKHTTVGAGPRTYYFGGPLAHLENALVTYALKRITGIGFALVSVPDILPESLIEACGFPTRGVRSQVYKLCSPANQLTYCLSGTSEMALGGFCAGRTFDPGEATDTAQNTATALGLCAASRCFRQEVPNQEDSLYRVHQFTKVEMFGLTAPSAAVSDAMFDRILKIQIHLFADLGLHFRVLEMPTGELGNPAHRKVDIEAWMPGSQMYGEHFQLPRLPVQAPEYSMDLAVS